MFLCSGVRNSYAFGSISDGVFHGQMTSPDIGTWFVEKAHYYFRPHAINDSFHSVIYHENDVNDPYTAMREGNYYSLLS